MMVVSLALVAHSSAALHRLHFDMESGDAPVTKVMGLLQDMKDQLNETGLEDDTLYNATMAWCRTQLQGAELLAAEAVQEGLTNDIAGFNATSERLVSEVSTLKAEAAAHADSLKTAAAMREKSSGEFHTTEKNLLESVSGLKGALTVLGNRTTLLQVPLETFKGIADTVQGEMVKNAAFFNDRLSTSSRELLENFVKRPSLLQDPVYSPRSGEIFGVLDQMRETFEIDLSKAQATEAKAVQDHQALTSAKQALLDSATSQLEAKQEELASTNQALAVANIQLKDAGKTTDADKVALEAVKVKCDSATDMYTKRSVARAKETAAVTEALDILSSQEALLNPTTTTVATTASPGIIESIFGSTTTPAPTEATTAAPGLFESIFGSGESTTEAPANTTAAAANTTVFAAATPAPSLIQIHRRGLGTQDKQTAVAVLTQAADILAKAGLNASHLTDLALQVNLDNFEKVKAAIDQMMKDLSSQSADEVKKRDSCIKQFNDIDSETAAKQAAKNGATRRVDTSTLTISSLNDSVIAANAQSAKMTGELAVATAERANESAAFEVTVTDQEQAQQFLKQAYIVLRKYYQAKGPVLLQIKRHDAVDDNVTDAAPNTTDKSSIPAEFKEYSSNDQNYKVMSLLQSIISDSEALEAATRRTEKQAIAQYKSYAAATQVSISDEQKSVVALMASLSREQVGLVQGQQALAEVVGELSSLSALSANLHQQCDDLISNFDLRQTARSEEIDALRASKAILSGAKFNQFLQRY